jgi:hypothetical protein
MIHEDSCGLYLMFNKFVCRPLMETELKKGQLVYPKNQNVWASSLNIHDQYGDIVAVWVSTNIKEIDYYTQKKEDEAKLMKSSDEELEWVKHYYYKNPRENQTIFDNYNKVFLATLGWKQFNENESMEDALQWECISHLMISLEEISCMRNYMSQSLSSIRKWEEVLNQETKDYYKINCDLRLTNFDETVLKIAEDDTFLKNKTNDELIRLAYFAAKKAIDFFIANEH